MKTSDYLDVLRERGLIKQISDEAGLTAALAEPITLYCGYDPTAASLTAGHLFPTALLRHAKRCGHRVIGLVGGATGMVGDPTGRTAGRNALSPEQVVTNLAGIRAQLDTLLDFSDGRGLVVNNADWHAPFHLLDFLREVGTHFSVAPMLAAETYESRLATGLTFTEFSYMLLQAYDFLHLYRQHDCILQVGGSDQWTNSLAGVDLIRRVEGGSAHVLVAPLLTTSAGVKMGKSATGTVWLAPERTSPYDFYQYWINVEDASVEALLAQLTVLPIDEVRRLGALQGADLRRAKEVLAMDVTAWVHGREAAEAARAASRALFGGDAAAAEGAPTAQISLESVAQGLRLLEVLADITGLCSSRGEARKLIEQGGAWLNGRRVADPSVTLGEADFAQGYVLLQAGKKKRCRLVLAPA